MLCLSLGSLSCVLWKLPEVTQVTGRYQLPDDDGLVSSGSYGPLTMSCIPRLDSQECKTTVYAAATVKGIFTLVF